jgi:hypothetical protein
MRGLIGGLERKGRTDCFYLSFVVYMETERQNARSAETERTHLGR